MAVVYDLIIANERLDYSSYQQSFNSFNEYYDHINNTFDFEIIKNAILAAGSAPNGANLQPWHFVVISDPNIKSKIRIAADSHNHAI